MKGSLQTLGPVRERTRTPAPVRDLRARDEAFALWSVARAEANLAYDWWCQAPGRDAYAVYRAAEDRADAAEQTLTSV